MKKGTLAVLLLCVLVSVSAAQTDIGLKGIGGRLGFIMPESGIDNTIGLGANADLGSISMFKVYAYLDYWSKSYEESNVWEWRWSVISLAAIGKYFFEIEGDFEPYAGAGLGFDISSWKSEYTGPATGFGFEDDWESSDSEFDLALHLLGGATYALTPTLDGFAELKYTTGGIDYFGIYVGVMYKL